MVKVTDNSKTFYEWLQQLQKFNSSIWVHDHRSNVWECVAGSAEVEVSMHTLFECESAHPWYDTSCAISTNKSFDEVM